MADTEAPQAAFSTRPSRAGRRLRRVILVGFLAAAAIVAVLPLTLTQQAADANLDPTTLGIDFAINKSIIRAETTIAMFIALAAAWNLIGGLTGYAAFGNVAFFGLGAYTVGFLTDKQHLNFALALPLAPLVAAVFAGLIGLPLLRLRGHYFAIATLGTGVAVGEVIKNIDAFGGGTGLFPPIFRHADALFFYLMAGTAALAVLTTWLVLRSRFGYGLIAIRENEEAASVLGVNTVAYKVAAFTLAAALTGLAGGVFAQWSSFIDQESVFPIQYNVQMILMAIIGGAGTLFGPVAGAIVLEWLILTLAGGGTSAVYAQIGLGVLLAVTVIFVPRGVVDFFGGSSKLSLAYLRRSLRETSV
ncbi:MAG TPA: branched-chain amino acid ABC transporter permease [Candidatus Dormibacteraeota bacterium]|jgi:branched-chain amino acid transport system permease protein